MFALLLWVALSVGSARQPVMLEKVPYRIVWELQRVQINSAALMLEEELAQHPDDPGLLGVQGTLKLLEGRYTEAAELLERSEGSRYYETFGISYHADLLRTLGDGRGAARLRAERLVLDGLNENREHLDLLDQVDDHRSVDDTDAAMAVIEQAMALGIRPAYYAAEAEVWMDLGELDAASESLWLAQRLGRARGVIQAEARLLMLLGNPTEAVELLDGRIQRNRRDRDFWLLLGEACRQEGAIDRTAKILALKRFERLDSPTQQALQARLLRDQGDLPGALSAIEAALAEAPSNPLLNAVADELTAGSP